MNYILLFLLPLMAYVPRYGETLSPPKTKVAILLYPGVELLDFAGPTEVFSLMENAEVFTVAAKPGSLTTMKNMLTITPDYSLADCPQPDILVIPGASPDHIRAVINDTALMAWIRQVAAKTQINMSVCTGAYVLGNIGVLDGKTITTHWAATTMLQQMTPKATVMEHTRFVEDGNTVTTAGVSAGIDGALRVVSRLRGPEAAQSIARIIDYDKWDRESGLIVGQPVQKSDTNSKPRPKTTPTPVKQVSSKKASAGLAAEGIDPVCQMTVPKGTQLVATFGQKQYGFCSEICQKRFTASPTTFVKP